MVLGLLAAGVYGQSNRSTRPRIASTPAPPTLGNDTTIRSPNGPPVLLGGKTPAANPAPTPPIEDDSDEIIRVETNIVTMPVSVLDRDGRFISALQQKDFKIFENGIEQKLDYFQSVEQPFTVILLIDVSPSTQFKIDEIQNAAISFINQLRPGDRVQVISFDEDVHILSPVTNNRGQLRNAIRSVQFGNGTSLYEAVKFVVDQQLRQIEGRKAVVLFSDGVDTTSRRASYESTLRATEEIDALFYTIRYDTSQEMGVGYPQPRSRRNVTLNDILASIITGGSVNMGGGRGGGRPDYAEYETGRKYLERLAVNSGGRNFEALSIYNVDAAFSGIAEELRRQYSIGYYPEKVGQIGERKQIKIRVMRPGVVVRAKSSYIVGQSNRSGTGK